jgi:hypothetical protein
MLEFGFWYIFLYFIFRLEGRITLSVSDETKVVQLLRVIPRLVGIRIGIGTVIAVLGFAVGESAKKLWVGRAVWGGTDENGE